MTPPWEYLFEHCTCPSGPPWVCWTPFHPLSSSPSLAPPSEAPSFLFLLRISMVLHMAYLATCHRLTTPHCILPCMKYKDHPEVQPILHGCHHLLWGPWRRVRSVRNSCSKTSISSSVWQLKSIHMLHWETQLGRPGRWFRKPRQQDNAWVMMWTPTRTTSECCWDGVRCVPHTFFFFQILTYMHPI